MASESPQAWKIIPEFRSLSITRTIDFYTSCLHFEVGGSHTGADEEEASFCSLFKGNKAVANIYFRRCKAQDFQSSNAWIAMSIEALEAFWDELQANSKVNIADRIENKEWGYRQFSVRDCDGNLLIFFRFLEDEQDVERAGPLQVSLDNESLE